MSITYCSIPKIFHNIVALFNLAYYEYGLDGLVFFNALSNASNFHDLGGKFSICIEIKAPDPLRYQGFAPAVASAASPVGHCR